MFQVATSRSRLLARSSCSGCFWTLCVHVDEAGAEEVLENLGQPSRPYLNSILYLLVHARGEIKAVAIIIAVVILVAGERSLYLNRFP